MIDGSRLGLQGCCEGHEHQRSHENCPQARQESKSILGNFSSFKFDVPLFKHCDNVSNKRLPLEGNDKLHAVLLSMQACFQSFIRITLGISFSMKICADNEASTGVELKLKITTDLAAQASGKFLV